MVLVPELKEGCYHKKKAGSIKSLGFVDVGFERGSIVMTLFEFYIVKLWFGLVIYNHLGSLPLHLAFKGEFYSNCCNNVNKAVRSLRMTLVPKL